MDSSDRSHLLAAGRTTNRATIHPLSTPSGMTRVGVETLRLAAGDRITITGAARAEGFVYVLDGRGLAVCPGERQRIGTGDCLGLAAGEALNVENPHSGPLELLVVFSEGGTGSVQPEP